MNLLVEMIWEYFTHATFFYSSDPERASWMEAVTPTQTSANPQEKIYEDWDCPRVESVEDYEAQDSDEIALRKGDTANVLRKMSDSGESLSYLRLACFSLSLVLRLSLMTNIIS